MAFTDVTACLLAESRRAGTLGIEGFGSIVTSTTALPARRDYRLEQQLPGGICTR